MRSLAHIEEIKVMHPIRNRDKIMLAEVLGWQVIVNKEQISVGDKVVYIEIDSVLPEKEEFEFLKSKNYRIKTMKMTGVISQGICFPLSILPEGDYKVGQDVTELLGVKQFEGTMDKEPTIREVKEQNKYPKFLMRMKWFRKLVLPKKQAKGFPSFISKTDETRIENAPFYLEDKQPWIATEKVDGQSGTFFLRKLPKKWWQKEQFDFGVCSRNLRLWKEDNSSYWSVARRYNIEKVLHELIGDNEFVAIQGECIGIGVQGNKYNVTEYDMYAFNLIYPTGRVGSLEAKKIIEGLGLRFVPIVKEEYILPDTIEELRKFAHGESRLYPTLREGIVFRTKDGQKSFKCVDPEFLLKNGE